MEATSEAPGVAISPSTAPGNLSAPLGELANLLPTIIDGTGYSEVWGVELTDPATHIPTQIVLQKYLNANDGSVASARDQLTKTLEWRAKMKPLEMVKARHSKEKFGGLGYVTVYETEASKSAEPEGKEIFTWWVDALPMCPYKCVDKIIRNIYGGVKNVESAFGNVEEFIAWRVALMELALQELSLPSATKPITATYDPYKITQATTIRISPSFDKVLWSRMQVRPRLRYLRQTTQSF